MSLARGGGHLETIVTVANALKMKMDSGQIEPISRFATFGLVVVDGNDPLVCQNSTLEAARVVESAPEAPALLTSCSLR